MYPHNFKLAITEIDVVLVYDVASFYQAKRILSNTCSSNLQERCNSNLLYIEILDSSNK